MQVFERSKITVWKRHIFQKENCCWSFRYVSTICRKVFSGAPVKCSFVFSWNNSDSFVFRNAPFGEIKDHILKKTAFSNKLYWSFRYMSVLHKKVFSRAPVKWFSLCGSYNSGSVFFSGVLVLERSRTTIWKRHIFRKKKENAIRSFTHVPPLHKRVFSRAPVKCFSLYSSNDLDSAVFRNAAFGEIKDHRLKKTTIQKKKMLFEVLGMCLPYIKRYFQEQKRSAFLFMAQMT